MGSFKRTMPAQIIVVLTGCVLQEAVPTQVRILLSVCVFHGPVPTQLDLFLLCASFSTTDKIA